MLVLCVVPCGCRPAAAPGAGSGEETLRGVVIRKEWTKSAESWNAGGSEYYVLKVTGTVLPAERQSAAEGVLLRPSDRVRDERFAALVGRDVICQGTFVAGTPYIPPPNATEQMPVAAGDPPTDEPRPEMVGRGFKVRTIESAAGN